MKRTVTVDWLALPGFLSKSATATALMSISSSGWRINRGESHLFLPSGHSYLLSSASNSAFEYCLLFLLSRFHCQASVSTASQYSTQKVSFPVLAMQNNSYRIPKLKINRNFSDFFCKFIFNDIFFIFTF